jgi:hypothetical protein
VSIYSIMEANHPPTSFTLFPQLPFELRLKIWRHCAPPPRIVAIGYKKGSSAEKGQTFISYAGWRRPKPIPLVVWTSPDPVPTTLHICHESRQEAMKSYGPSFGSVFHQGEIYFNFAKDTLRFGNGQGPDCLTKDPAWLNAGPSDYLLDLVLGGGYCGADDTEKVQSMIIDLDEGVYGRKLFCWDEIREFSSLKELTIMPWEEDDEVARSLMDTYRQTLGTVARNHPEWKVPKITVVNALSGTCLGLLTLGAIEV